VTRTFGGSNVMSMTASANSIANPVTNAADPRLLPADSHRLSGVEDTSQMIGVTRRLTVRWRRPIRTRRGTRASLRTRWFRGRRDRLGRVALGIRGIRVFGDLEIVEVPLTEEHCHALGLHAEKPAARRRTFNDAGLRGVRR
jgi:hypothetical protein